MRKSEESLIHTRNYLQSILDNAFDMIITTDNDSKIVEFNAGAEKTLGYKRKEVLGKDIASIYRDSKERAKLLEQVKRHGHVSNYETMLVAKDGSKKVISLTLSQLKDETGKVLGTVGISKDITLKKKVEEELKEKNLALEKLSRSLEEKVRERTMKLEAANRNLKEASRMKSEFLANMSHELRTPLNAVLGFSEILLDRIFGDINEKQGEHLKNIYNSGKKLLDIINDILDISKIEAGRMYLQPVLFPVNSFIQQCVNEVMSSAIKKNIEINTIFDAKVTTVYADEARFRQILNNLLSNAIKFTDRGGRVKVVTSLYIESAGKEWVRIEVSDTGIGISKKDRGHIFDTFRQIDSSKTRQHEGTGLGLALCKKLVDMHGGKIWLESKLGAFSSFYFTMPTIKTQLPPERIMPE